MAEKNHSAQSGNKKNTTSLPDKEIAQKAKIRECPKNDSKTASSKPKKKRTKQSIEVKKKLQKLRDQVRYLKNKDFYTIKNAKYWQENKDRLTPIQKKYRQENAEYIRQRHKKWKASNPNIKIAANIKSSLNNVLTGRNKTSKYSYLLGISVEGFKKYIESKFRPGMTWENYGLTTWHLDHKVPISAYNLSDPEQLKAAFHYLNVQPLPAAENIAKNSNSNGIRYRYINTTQTTTYTNGRRF